MKQFWSKETDNYRVLCEGPKRVVSSYYEEGVFYFFQAESPEQAVARYPGSLVQRLVYLDRPDVPENVGLPSTAFVQVS